MNERKEILVGVDPEATSKLDDDSLPPPKQQINIMERVFKNRRTTLTEYLILLASHVDDSQECISKFIEDFSVLTHEHVVLPFETQHQTDHPDYRFRLHWMQYIHEHDGRLIVVYLEDTAGNSWMGSWNGETKRYLLTPCTASMSSTLIKPCTDFNHLENTVHNCGPMMFHPKNKSPIIPHIVETLDVNNAVTLTFLEWSTDDWTTQDKFTPSESSCDHLKPIKLTISRK